MNAIETAIRKIGAIDKRIDAVRAELLRNEAVDELSAHSWQRAWDRHPVLRAIETSLFLRRSKAADIHDRMAAKKASSEAARNARTYRTVRKPCPVCGQQIAVGAVR